MKALMTLILFMGLSGVASAGPLDHPCQVDFWTVTNNFEVVDARPAVLNAFRGRGLEPTLWGHKGSYSELEAVNDEAGNHFVVFNKSWQSNDSEIGLYALNIDSMEMRLLQYSPKDGSYHTVAREKLRHDVPQWDGGSNRYERRVKRRNIETISKLDHLLSKRPIGCGRQS